MNLYIKRDIHGELDECTDDFVNSNTPYCKSLLYKLHDNKDLVCIKCGAEYEVDFGYYIDEIEQVTNEIDAILYGYTGTFK